MPFSSLVLLVNVFLNTCSQKNHMHHNANYGASTLLSLIGSNSICKIIKGMKNNCWGGLLGKIRLHWISQIKLGAVSTKVMLNICHTDQIKNLKRMVQWWRKLGEKVNHLS